MNQNSLMTRGTPRKRVDWRYITLIESDYSAGTRIGPHFHEQAVYVFVLDGAMQTTTSSGTIAGGPNTIRLVPPGERHSNSYGDRGARCLLMQVAADLLDRIGDAVPLPKNSVDVTSTAAIQIMRRIYDEFVRDDSVAGISVTGLFLELLAELSRSSDRHVRPPRWLERARQALDERFGEAITIGGLSSETGVHPVHLARLFRRHFGVSPSAYLRARRLEWAGQALVSTRAPMSVIALDAGFSDQAHFTRDFRRAMGLTPSTYRRLHAR